MNTPLFNKHHYIWLAAFMYNHVRIVVPFNLYQRLIMALSDALRIDNPNFKGDLFYDACTIEKETRHL